jgi:type 1 glutamine amidotransferase
MAMNKIKCGIFLVLLGLMAISLAGACGLKYQGQEKNNLDDRHPPQKEKPHIVFLISEDPDNYEAHKTIPPFAEMLENEEGFQVTVLKGKGERSSYEFPGLEVLSEADLVVIFCRRLALPEEQLDMIQQYLKKGKPLVGIRTANHAFSVRDEKIPEGYQDWWDFVPDILGSENRGYGPVAPGTEVSIAPEAKDHPIVEGIEPAQWHSEGNMYLVSPLLDKNAEVLLTGTVGDKTEPIAWARMAKKSRVFYTSLGYPNDFEVQQFKQLLINGIKWTLDMK